MNEKDSTAAAAAPAIVEARTRLNEWLNRIDAASADDAVSQFDKEAAARLNEALAALSAAIAQLCSTVDGRKPRPRPPRARSTDSGAPADQVPQTATSPVAVSVDAGKRLDSVEELRALGADSVVIQTGGAIARPRSYQRGDDGRWTGRGLGREGVTSERLWRSGGELIVVLRSRRPVVGGSTQIETIRSEADYHGWASLDTGPEEIVLTRGTAVVQLRYRHSTGAVTKGTKRWQDDTRVERTAAVGAYGTVRRWVTAQPLPDPTEQTPQARPAAPRREASQQTPTSIERDQSDFG
ncbi:hypothetical protein ACFYTQ_28340 [Nocardia sp. NPDC004068]|uniref:hypothetical protein n=1 Tax=Nocardia sp. NPDC004068 TaxID=3364303 RepID=UPI0036A8C2C6